MTEKLVLSSLLPCYHLQYGFVLWIAATIGLLAILGWFYRYHRRERIISAVVSQYLAGLRLGWPPEEIEECIFSRYGLVGVPAAIADDDSIELPKRIRICQTVFQVLQHMRIIKAPLHSSALQLRVGFTDAVSWKQLDAVEAQVNFYSFQMDRMLERDKALDAKRLRRSQRERFRAIRRSMCVDPVLEDLRAAHSLSYHLYAEERQGMSLA